MNDTNVDSVTHADAVDALKKAGNTVRLVSLFIYFITKSNTSCFEIKQICDSNYKLNGSFTSFFDNTITTAFKEFPRELIT